MIGQNTFVNYDCVFLDCNRITIGDHVQIGPIVQIYTAQHPTDPETRRSGLVAVAGSVVIRDLPPNVIAVGNPCRIIRSC
jgi:maltose O-acetyltransferase